MTSFAGATHLEKLTETTKLSYDVGRLDISVIEAKDLLDKDIISLSDPYCIIKLGTQEVRNVGICS